MKEEKLTAEQRNDLVAYYFERAQILILVGRMVTSVHHGSMRAPVVN